MLLCIASLRMMRNHWTLWFIFFPYFTNWQLMSHFKPHCNVFTCNSLSLTFIVSSLSRIMLFSCSIILPWASHCMARSLSAIMSLLPFGYRQTYILMHIVNNGYFFSFVEIRQKLLQFRIQFNHKDYKSINFYKLN